jgi:ABC-2 type transport system permease protein
MIDKMLFFLPAASTGFFQFLGADYHFRNIARGVLDSRDLIYFLSLSFLALFGTYLVLEQKK